MRILALGGLVAPVLFATVVVWCAAQRPDYRHAHQFISELGATATPYASVMNTLGLVPTGLLLAGFGASIARSAPRPARVAVGASLVVVFGAAIALSGLFSCDAGCPQTGGSTENLVHQALAPTIFVSGSLGAILLGIRFRGISRLRPLWLYSVASGVLGFCLLAAVASTFETRAFTGVWQRLMVSVLLAWCAVVGLRLFREGRVAAPSA
jgi:hypothetical membrane protein